MKYYKGKLFFIAILVFLISISNIYSQSGWVSTFFNNTNTFSKIVKKDSLNYFAFCRESKYFYKSTDGGNSWICTPNNSFDSLYTIYDGQFINSLTGWIVGLRDDLFYGVIYKTTNGGLNWFKQNVGNNNRGFYCLYFLDSNIGWIGSGSPVWGTGYLYKTTNGGINWSLKEFNGAAQINSIKFFDTDNGWIMGHYNLIAKTSDGGLTWIQKPINNIPPASYTSFLDLYSINNNEVWVLVDCNSGYIFSHFFKTTNGGDNWILMYSYTDSLATNARNFYKINFINSYTGFSNGDYGFIIRTTNSGLNWSKIYVSSFGMDNIISSLLPVNNNDIFSCGGPYIAGSQGPFNFLYKSTNAGVNWSLKTYNREFTFLDIKFINNNTGFVIADSGRIYKTTNSGGNWNLVFSNNIHGFSDIAFPNSTTGYVIGNYDWYYNFYSNGRMLKTTNGGNNWDIFLNMPYQTFYTLTFIDQNTGFIGCDSNLILRTTNAGTNWNTVSIPAQYLYHIRDISFINNTTGYLFGIYSYYSISKSAIYKTTNAGNNWSVVFDSSGSIFNTHIYFVNNEIGFKYYGSVNLQKTTNGGTNWFYSNLPYINNGVSSMRFINSNTGWIGGNNSQLGSMIIKTTNGGVNWLLQFNEHSKGITSIFAFDSDNAWLCGGYSSIYKTTNGGGNIGIKKINDYIPSHYSLSQNYPNPFNPTTNIRYQIPNNSYVVLKIYDILGKEIATLVNEKLKAGEYESTFDGSGLPSGVYFYKLEAGEYSETKKMLVIK